MGSCHLQEAGEGKGAVGVAGLSKASCSLQVWREWLLLCGMAGAIPDRLGIAFFSCGNHGLRDNFVPLTANQKGEKRPNTGWLLSTPLGPWQQPQEWGAGPAEHVLAVPPGTCEVGRGQCPSLGAVCVLAHCGSPVPLVAGHPELLHFKQCT